MPPAGARAAHRQRLASVLDLHARGRSVQHIAAALGVTQHRAASLLGQAVAELPAQDVETIRATSEVRLDLAARIYGDVLDDPDADARTKTQAAAGLVTVERERSRLMGSWQRPEKDD